MNRLVNNRMNESSDRKKEWTIGKKLSVSFLSTAIVTLIVALIGVVGSNILNNAIEEVADVRLPSVSSLLSAEVQTEELNGLIRLLAVSGLSMENRRDYYQEIEVTIDGYHEAIDIFAPLPQTVEGSRMWQAYDGLEATYFREFDRFMEFSLEIDRFGIGDPVEISRQIEGFERITMCWYREYYT